MPGKRPAPQPAQGDARLFAAREVQGEVQRVTYRNAESGFSVVQLRLDRGGSVALVGALPELQPGERVRATGQAKRHPTYGAQFEVKELTRQLPVSREGIVAYLSSGLIPGVGPKIAERLYERFGDQTLEVLRNQPERLQEVPGIGRRRVGEAQRAAKEQVRLERLVVALRPYEVPLHVARKIEVYYGDRAEAVVQREPFRLWREVGGIGFLTADRVARAMGIGEDAPERMEALVLYLLQSAADEGHVALPAATVPDRGERFSATAQGLEAAVQRLAQGGAVVLDGELLYLTRAFQMESRVARAVAQRLRAKVAPVALRQVGTLTPEQAKAAQSALSSPLFLLTGGPGTGKTTTVRAIAQGARSRGLRVALAAPTGRAAKRVQEASGISAQTLHRLLGLRGPQTETRQVEADLLIVDESSMVDLWLLDRLLGALSPTTRLVLVGDADQLPPVGAGEPLTALLALPFVPRAELREIFRQAAQSGIVQAAHRIRQGQLPQTARDFVWLRAETPADVQAQAVRVATQELPGRGIEPDEIQVLSAGHRNETGVQALNAALQAQLNPGRGQPEARLGDRVFRLGDRVVQLRNDYQRGALNGEVGRIVALSARDRAATVAFPDPSGEREVAYSQDELRQLQLGYATTVHKAQGSEYRAVVLVLSAQHWMLLGRNLFYTAVTRAREVLVLIAPQRAVWQALRNAGRGVRHGRLAERIAALYGGGDK